MSFWLFQPTLDSVLRRSWTLRPVREPQRTVDEIVRAIISNGLADRPIVVSPKILQPLFHSGLHIRYTLLSSVMKKPRVRESGVNAPPLCRRQPLPFVNTATSITGRLPFDGWLICG
jgi:hypothetical protein